MSSLFSFANSQSIGIYIDYSNLYHAKYTLGREYDIQQFFEAIESDPSIFHIWFYGAYDKANVKQFNWTQKLQKRFVDPKFSFYFKKLETKGEKQKGNVDTEMGFDIAEQKDKRDTLVLFSWDGDFQYIVDKIIKNNAKKVVIISTRGHINKDLINYTQQYDIWICRFLDIQQESEDMTPVRDAMKAHDRWVCIPPELVQKLQIADAKEIEQLKSWVECILQHHKDKCDLPLLLDGLENRNKYSTYKTILHWKAEEKQWMCDYLDSLL